MRFLMLAFAALFAPVMGGCPLCNDPPDNYKGALMNGGYSGYGYSCYTYANSSCDYTLCQRDGCGRDWELESWFCW